MIRKLAVKVHKRIAQILEVDELFLAEEQELYKLDERIEAMIGNSSITYADAETVARLEFEFGVSTDDAKPLSQRKSVILAKLRGSGVTTPAFIRNLANSFENGDIEVIESVHTPYIIKIKFISVRGKPPNLLDFEHALREIMPAHIAIEYIFTYFTWDEFDSYNKTWNAWDALNLKWQELELYKE